MDRRLGITDTVAKKLQDRAAVGKEKYGQTMDRTDLDTTDWLNHLQEELLDAAQYVEALIRKVPRDPVQADIKKHLQWLNYRDQSFEYRYR